ncbi:MAG: hypothetical protein KAI29_19655 [Cyclobacteriaceae bacterium]|nr:hypothetical protein [Cyclobacteriaceae bacterium]
MNLSKRSITAFLFSILTVFIFQTGFAQKPEAEIERFIKDYAKAYENITKTRDKQSVLKYVSKDLFSTIIKSNVVDNFGLIQASYADFDSYLEQVLRTDGMVVNYDVKDILRSKVRGKSGVVVCEIGVQVSSKGEIWNKGTELTTFVLKKFKSGWKILNFNVVSLEEEQNKGTCMTEVFKASTGNYMVKTIVPKGSTYEYNVNNFEFNPGNGIVYISLDGENSYSWLRDGPITKMAEGNQPEKVVGQAIDEHQAVLNIIKLDLYKSNCLTFKSKK